MQTIPREIKIKLRDKNYRLNHFYKIRNKDEKLVTFKLNRAQKHFRENAHTRNIILKSRQLGFTTLEAIEGLDDCLWNPNFQALMISYDKESALEIFDDKIDLAWQNYPDLFKSLYEIDTNRANKLKFGFGDKTYSSILVRTKGRSGTFNKVHVSEFAKICAERPRKAREILTGTIPAVPINGRADIESTAEGIEGLFYEIFWEAWERQKRGVKLLVTEFKAHFYNWTWDDDEIAKIERAIPFSEMEDADKFKEHQKQHNLSEIQITYYYLKWKSLNKDWDMLHQEYPTTPEEAFIASTNTVIPKQYIENQRKFIRQPIRMMDDVIIYEDRKNHYYSLGGDPSEGRGKDDSSLTVIDKMTGREVAFYTNNSIQPDQFARKMAKVAEYFNNAIIVPEINSHGLAVLNELQNIGYTNIFQQKFYDKLSQQWQQRLGWKTTRLTKPLMVDEFIQALREEEIGLSSSTTVNQMGSFVHNDTPGSQGMGAVQGKKDDALISAMLAWQGLKDLPSKFKYD